MVWVRQCITLIITIIIAITVRGARSEVKKEACITLDIAHVEESEGIGYSIAVPGHSFCILVETQVSRTCFKMGNTLGETSRNACATGRASLPLLPDSHLVDLAVLAEVFWPSQHLLGIQAGRQASCIHQVALHNAHVGQLTPVGHRGRAARPAPAPPASLLLHLFSMQVLHMLLVLVVVPEVQGVLVLPGRRGRRRRAGRVCVFLLGSLLLVVFVLDDLFFVDGCERMRVVGISGAARRAEAGVVLLDAVPTPHAHPIPARARDEVLVREVHVLTAEGAHVVVTIVRVVEGIAAGHDDAVAAGVADPSNALRPR